MAATPGTPQFLMADRMVRGGLVAAMRRLFDESGSWEQVSRDLYAESGVVISGQTLRRWALTLDEQLPA